MLYQFSMKITMLALLILLLCGTQQLQILHISSSPTSVSNPIFLSLRGGGMIYIKALGYSPDPTQNSIQVGSYPCIIPSDGVTDTYIACETTDTGSWVNVDNLPVTLKSNGMTVSTSWPNRVYFRTHQTPELREVFPSAGYAGSSINLYGKHEISDLGDGLRNMGDVVKLRLGEDLCSRFDVEQAAINRNSYEYIRCIQSSTQQAGRYNVSEHVLPGYANNSYFMRRSSLNPNEYFEFTALPTVSGVSPNSGNMGGQLLTISGTGFSMNPQNNSVTVDGNNCRVTESSNNQLKCTLDPKNTSSSSQLATNSSAGQQNGYFSGAGVNYVRYAMNTAINNIQKFVNAIRTANTTQLGTPLEEGIRAELRQPDIHGTYTNQHWNGYFTAPVTGTYTFRGTSDDDFMFYINPTYGSSQPAAQPFIYHNSWTSMWAFFSKDIPTAKGSINLVKGRSYYIEAYSMNWAGPGHLSISVEVPNTNTQANFKTYEVDNITTISTVQEEKINFSFVGANLTGQVQLEIIRTDPNTLKTTYHQLTNVSYGASQSQFRSALQTFDGYKNYGLTVLRTIYDSGNNVINTTSGAAKIDYTVSIYLLRPASMQSEKFKVQYFNGYLGTFTEKQIQNHSALVNGTWTLSIGGVPIKVNNSTDLPYNIGAGTLQNALVSSGIVGFSQVQVTRVTSDGCEYSCSWVIEYIGFYKTIPSISTNAAMLTGGVGSPTIAVRVERPFSNNIEFNPIDYRFLHTYSNSVNVHVMTNGVPSVCLGNCTYSFHTYTELTSLSMSGSVLMLGLSDPMSLGFTLNDINVTVQGRACTINPSGSISSFTCAMATNSDSTPILTAGSITPVVYVRPYGIANLQGVTVNRRLLVTTTPLSVSMVASSLSSTSGGNNGGYLISLHGSGFPFDKNMISISICGSLATIQNINNIQIDFYVPACSSLTAQTVTLTYGSMTDTSLTYTYTDASGTAPTISFLSPSSSNPAVKGALQITGNGFGSNASVVKVFLSNSTGKVYQLKVLSLNNTHIKAGLPGGNAGNYKVEVNVPSTGDSIVSSAGANNFAYELKITSISPSTGSFYGGTLLKITGVNFSPSISQTMVYVGDTLNWFCSIESLTTTQVLCRTPPISSAYTPGTAVNVVMSTKITELNTCPGSNCRFTYMASNVSATLSNLSKTSTGVGQVTATGLNLVDGSNFAEVVLTNLDTLKKTVVTANSTNSTDVIFDIAATIEAGQYTVRIRNSKGESNPLNLQVNWDIGSRLSSSLSVAGSVDSYKGGAGFPSSITGMFSVSLYDPNTTITTPANIVQCCAGNTIDIEIPAFPDGKTVQLKFVSSATSNTRSYTAYTSTTPTGVIATPLTLSPGTSEIRVNMTNNVSATLKGIYLISQINSMDKLSIANNSWVVTGSKDTAVIAFNASLLTGKYKLFVSTDPYGFVQLTNNIINVNFPTQFSTVGGPISFNGGNFTITAPSLSKSSYITVNSLRGDILQHTSTHVVYQVPAFVTMTTQTAFGLSTPAKIPQDKLTLISDMGAASNVSAVADGVITSIYGSTNSVCWLGVDAGQGVQIVVDRIRLFPNIEWPNVGKKILFSTVEGSNDMNNWNSIATIDQTIHSGWNFLKTTSGSMGYRYIRFRHNSSSQCNIAQFQVYGTLYSTTSETLSSTVSDVVFHDGFNTKTFAGALDFRQDHTPTVLSVNPRYGDITGGYPLTLTGTNLNASAAKVTIDGADCAVTSANISTIVCTVGARASSYNMANSFKVSVGSSEVILKDTFLYVLRWSSPATWGVDIPPVDNDLIFVPKGTTLLVDQNTPILEGISVQGGTLIFDDTMDLTVRTGFIIMNGGTFIAGTQQHPHNSKLTFVMYGDYYGKQIPMFGNKGIGCLNCKFSMFGKPRSPTWTTLAATANVGDSQLTVSQPVDWQVGEQIVIASTSFVHEEAEQFTITGISGQTISINGTFMYKHVSVLQTHGSNMLEMRAEVGLLTRNIKMMGDPSSLMKQYGSHLMLTGQGVNGFEGHIAYSEFMHCGQPQILGRYCTHFHMAGDVPTSFAKGIAVHDSFARIITIHGVHHLTVEDNVGFRVKGHNFFVEDGIQTHNTIRNNLAISSIQTTRMLQTDTSTASFWITNPTNDVYGNHAAGGDFYGIWYEIKPNPDGPSATMDVCPMGNPLGFVNNNTAHSNKRFGLRIFILASRWYPCDPIRNDTLANDPWAQNPSVQSVFSNFTVYKNLQDGVLAQQTGNVVFDNFVIAENYNSGIEFYVGNFTKEPPTVKNSVIIGVSSSNAHSNTSNYTNKMSAVITGKTGSYLISNVKFHNYPQGSLLIQTCRFCDDPLKYTNLGTEVSLTKLTLTNVTGMLLNMIGLKRDVIYDLDGSLSNAFDGTNRSSATIVHGFPHIAAFNTNDCPPASTPTDWDSAVMCGPAVKIRRVWFTNLDDQQLFNANNMKATQIASISDVVATNISSSMHTSVPSRLPGTIMEPKGQKKQSYGLPFITGKIYNIWWGTGIDFTHMSVVSSSLFTSQDMGILFKFNYSASREMYDVWFNRGGQQTFTNLDMRSQSPTPLSAASCINGEYFHNDTVPSRMLQVCQSGKNRSLFEYTEVNAVTCRYACPTTSGNFTRQPFVRRWSNASQWPNGVVPVAGDNVTVNGNWTVLLDVDPAYLNYLTVDGIIFADDRRDVTITANSIYVTATGNISAGSSTSPFLHKFTIRINGSKTDAGHTIDSILSGNKFMVVTGHLNLVGRPPTTAQTTLKQTATAGSSTIFVGTVDWAAGDTIVLSPSFSNSNEHERKVIQSVNLDGSITLTTPLAYTHYGASTQTINNHYGTLDTRTRVGHITRNIQIVSGTDVGWGFSVIVYGYFDNTTNNTYFGNVNLKGVHFDNGGQLDSLNAPLTFLNVLNVNLSSHVSDSTFTDCKASCLYVKNSKNITFVNNVMHHSYVFGAQLSIFNLFNFSRNLIIGVVDKPTITAGSQLVACLYVAQYVDPTSSSIKDNYCLGSSQHGFAVPFAKCSSSFENNAIANNTVGSAKIGFIINTINDQCQAFSYAKAFACQIGQICGPPGISSIQFDHFIMADNLRGVTLKMGASEGGSNHSAYLYNSYITAISRPNCPECYGSNATACTNAQGMRMFTASANGEVLPAKFGSGFDVVCKQPVYDSKSFLQNVTFDNFQQSYTGLSTCSSNFVFKPHPGGFDMVGSVNLFNSMCTNCDSNSYLKAPNPDTNFLGWFGGCGDIVCTGFDNYQVQDHTGTFLGQKGTIIPNNTQIGINQGCTFSSTMNAYTCLAREDFGVLQYQSVAADFKTRIMWPVNLTAQGYNYTTVTNGWREWEWLGNEPLNKRFGRFVSLVLFNRTYNMTFASMPPEKMQLQIQKRTPRGNNSNYLVVKLHYPKPNSIRLQLNGVQMEPKLVTDAGMSALNTSKCGDHSYYYNNYTIIFVLTEAENCLVTVYLSENIQLTTHFAMNASDFFSNSSYHTMFIDRLSAALGITDKSRVKIVGVYSGSMTVISHILSSTAPGATPLTTINQNVQSSIQSGSLASNMNSGGFGSMLGASSTYNPPVSGTSTTPSTPGDDNFNIGLIVGAAVGGTVVLVALIVLFVVLWRRNRESQEETPKEMEMNEATSPTTKQHMAGSNPMMSSTFTPGNMNRDHPENGYYQNYDMTREQPDPKIYEETPVSPYVAGNQNNMYYGDRREPLNSGQGLNSPYPPM